jgi:PAS domain S-box-containing protein
VVKTNKRSIQGPEMLQTLLDAALSPIITIDKYGIMQTCNNATPQLFGYVLEELIGKKC